MREYLTWQDLPTTVTANGVICSTAQIENDFREQEKRFERLKELSEWHTQCVESLIQLLTVEKSFDINAFKEAIASCRKARTDIHHFLNKF